jgi:hypothetical protein
MWEYKLFDNQRAYLANLHPILKELTGCSYCQMIECSTFLWVVFELTNVHHYPIPIGLGYVLFFGWTAWVISLLENLLDRPKD